MLRTTFENRKDLVKAIGEYTGETPRYKGAPTFAYEVGSFTIGKDGSITSEMDMSELESYLIEKGFVERHETDDTETKATTEDTEIVGINTHFSIEGIEEQAVIQLLNMLYSKQYLINKAVGFEVLDISSEIITEIQNKPIREVKFDSLTGIRLEDNELIFLYPNVDDTEMLNAYVMLISKAFEKAKESKHCRADYSEPENEKYYMRSWIIRMGLGGKEHSKTRKILLKNLKGNVAFKTNEEMEAFKLRRRKGNR